MGNAKSKYLWTNSLASFLLGRSRKEGSDFGKGASPKLKMGVFNGNEILSWSLFWIRSKNETPEDGPT